MIPTPGQVGKAAALGAGVVVAAVAVAMPAGATPDTAGPDEPSCTSSADTVCPDDAVQHNDDHRPSHVLHPGRWW